MSDHHIPPVIEKILDEARWAPSGDNTQPWRFEVVNGQHIVVHGRDTRDHCVYDLQGHASQLSIGALMETISITASVHNLAIDCCRRLNVPDTTPTFDVRLQYSADLEPDPLSPFVRARTVQRRAMRLRRLDRHEIECLEASIGPAFKIAWMDHFSKRLQTTLLTFKTAGLRLSLPEAYEVHSNVIEWCARYSDDKIPDQAIGTSPLTTSLMRWALQSWRRVAFLNRYLGGTLAPRIELELIPGLACASHFVILAPKPPESIDDFISAGRKVQRFWLTATELGLHIQPEMTPLIFHEYMLDDIRFSKTDGMFESAEAIGRQLTNLIGVEESKRAVFMGRIGSGSTPRSRSTRLPLNKLLINPTE